MTSSSKFILWLTVLWFSVIFEPATTEQQPSTSNVFYNETLFAPLNPNLIEFCKQELEKAVKESSPTLLTNTFSSLPEQKMAMALAKRQAERSKPTKKAKDASKISSEEEIVKSYDELILKQATRNYQQLLKSYEMVARNFQHQQCKTTFDDKLFKSEAKAVQDMRLLSSTPGSGLKSVLFSLFGKCGLKPLLTTYGYVVTATSLASPTSDLNKLTKRKETVQKLVDNPELLTRAKDLLEQFALAQSRSHGLLLNPEYIEPFDPIKHGSLDKWKSNVASKVFSIEAFDQFTGGLTPAVAQFCTSKLSALGILAVGSLFEIIMRVLNDKSADFDPRIEAYMIFLLMAAVYVPLHIFAVLPTFDGIKKRLQKIDKFLKIKPSTAITANVALAPFLSNAQYTEYWFINMIAKDFLEALLVMYCWPMIEPLFKNCPQTNLTWLKNSSDRIFKIFFQSFKNHRDDQRPPLSTAAIPSTTCKKCPQTMRAWIYLALVSAVSIGVIANFYLSTFKNLYNKRKALAKAHKLLCNFKNMIKTAKELEVLVFGNKNTTEKLLKKTDFGLQHWPVLNSKLFDQESNYSVLTAGKIIATTAYLGNGISTANNVTTLDKEKPINLDQFTPLMIKMGEIDLLVATAELIIESKKQQNGFCLPEFIGNSSEAAFKGTGVWHPLIGQSKAIANDFDFTQGCRGAIVTGGNATGKSIACGSIATTVYLAQGLGVVPAQSLILKPFDRLFIQINSVDDPESGKSLFRAQIAQLVELICDTKKNCVEDLTAFIYLDESLSGTKPKYADAIFQALIKHFFAQNKHCTLLFSTHLQDFPMAVNRLSDNSILPMRVACQTDDDGHFVASEFKLEPGISNLDTALNVLSEEADKTLGKKESEALLKSCKLAFAQAL